MKQRFMPPLLMAVLLLASCTRDHLYYAADDMATVLVETDWSASERRECVCLQRVRREPV